MYSSAFAPAFAATTPLAATTQRAPLRPRYQLHLRLAFAGALVAFAAPGWAAGAKALGAKALDAKALDAKAQPAKSPIPQAPSKPQAARPAAPAARQPAAAASSAVPGRAPLFALDSLSLRMMKNGVRSIVRETRGSGLVAVQVWVRAGSRYETNASAGASHLIETLAMDASKNYPPTPKKGVQALDGTANTSGGATGAIEALGGVANSQTARDSTSYSATVAAAFLPDALRALSDAVLRPLLSDAGIEAAKAEVEESLQLRSVDPVATASDLAYQTAFTKHPYRRPANGSTDSIEKLSGARVRAYHAARYVGANISVVVVGDIRAAAAHALAAQLFAPAAATRPAQTPVAVESAPLAHKTVARRGPFSRALVALAFRAPGITTAKDVVAMDVLLAHWGEGREAVLRRVLRGDASDAPSSDNNSGDNAPGGESDDAGGDGDGSASGRWRCSRSAF